jgi:hypothetical protein
VIAAVVALIGEGDQANRLELGQDGSVPGEPENAAVWLAMNCRFIPCFLCLPE